MGKREISLAATRPQHSKKLFPLQNKGKSSSRPPKIAHLRKTIEAGNYTMRSKKQIEASRNNGAKSKGPKSKEGKAKASKNGNRHNLTGSHLMLLSTEDPVEFLQHENEYLQRFQPIDGVERDLVRKLIVASWREKRKDVMEASLLELETQKQASKISREFEFIGGETRQTLALLGTEDVGKLGIVYPGTKPPPGVPTPAP